MAWRRVTGEGYDLEGTDFGVRWMYATDEDGDFLSRKEWAVIALSNDENLNWFDSCAEAKADAERRARS